MKARKLRKICTSPHPQRRDAHHCTLEVFVKSISLTEAVKPSRNYKGRRYRIVFDYLFEILNCRFLKTDMLHCYTC